MSRSKYTELAARAGWGITDQMLSSITNFALAIVIARSFSPTAFGAFSVAYLIYLLLLQLSRTLTSQPLVVRYSAANAEQCRTAATRAVGLSAAIGLAAGGAIALTALAFSGQLRMALFALALVLPGLLVQDGWRFAFFAAGRPALAAQNDGAWAVIQFSLLAYLLSASSPTVAGCIFAWGGAATAAAVFGSIQARLAPSIKGSASWLREHADLGWRYAAEFLIERASLQLALFVVGIVAGLAALGSLRAAQVLMGPLVVLFLSAEVVAVPETVRILDSSHKRLRQSAVALSGVLTGVAIAWGIFLVLAPDTVGEWLLGPNWAAAHPLLIPVTLATAATAANMGPWTALRALQAAATSLRTRVIVAPITVVPGVLGAFVGAALGAAIGSAAGRWLAVMVWWNAYRAELDDGGSRRPPEPAPRISEPAPGATLSSQSR
jgi:O-antigen/teichoic acid export membrane protein